MHQIQRVERRLMLFAELASSTLQVTGTPGDDVIRVEYNTAGDRFVATLNGVSMDFEPVDLLGINVNAGDGNDSVFAQSRSTLPGQSVFAPRRASLLGDSGDDTLIATAGNDFLEGGAGNDLLDGGSGGDLLIGGDGEDNLQGRSGRDTLDGGPGADTLSGGADSGTTDYSSRSADLTITLDGIANDGAAGENDNVILCSTILGGSGDDSIAGDSRRNQLLGNGGGDTLIGNGGNDDLYASGRTTPDPSETQNHFLDGGSGDDAIFAGDGDDQVFGRDGDDRLFAGGGDDSITGGSGNDSIEGSEGADSITGDAGSDTINAGSSANDSVDGGSGDDAIVIRPDNSIAFGRGGADTLIIGFGTSSNTPPATISGGGGTDTLNLNDAAATQPLQISLDGVGNDGRGAGQMNIAADFERIDGGLGDDRIDASMIAFRIMLNGLRGDDTLIAGSSADTLDGDGVFIGNDLLVGNAGDDVLRGGNGRDTLTGGPGLDSFNGGFGNDIFNAADGEADTVNGAQGLGDAADVDELLDTLIRVETTT